MGGFDSANLSQLEYLSFLAQPDTATQEVTVLAENVIRLINNQYRFLEIISEMTQLLHIEAKRGG